MKVLDAASGDIIGTIEIGGKLEAICFDGRGQKRQFPSAGALPENLK